MNKKINIKPIALLLSPLLLFPILFFPYLLLNSAVIVDWLGCGCPKLNEYGEVYYSAFNANDFTRLFWLFISICVTVISIFLSRKIPKGKWWLRVVYVVGMLAVSLVIAIQFSQIMMWH